MPSPLLLPISMVFPDVIFLGGEELELLFDTESDKKWSEAIKKTGIDFTKFSSFSGNA